MTHQIPGGRLDFYDVGALVGEHHGRHLTGYHTGQVEDSDTLERTGHLRSP
jgi:hypothetical protein